jgi:hypothetical protein
MLLQRKGHRGRLVHKRLEGEVAAVRAPEGKNSGAGAKPLCTMSSEFWMIPVDLHKIFLGLLAGFSERTPYPSGKRSDGGAVRKVCRGCCCWALGNAFPSKDCRTVLLQLPNSYPCIRVHKTERQFDLFVSVKGNVDAVQSS